MFRLSAVATIAAMLLVTGPAAAQVTLTYKYPDGRQAVTETDIRTHQVLKIAGMNVETKSQMKLTTESKNGVRADDGKLEVKDKITGVKASLSTPAGDLEFDSDKPDAPPAGTALDFLLDAWKAMHNSEFTTIYDKTNRVVKIVGRDDFVKELNPQLQELLKSQLDPDYLVDATNQELDKLPSTPVEVGDTWERTEVARLEAGQSLTFEQVYKYEGVVAVGDRQLHKITATTKSVELNTDDSAPIKIKESDLKAAASENVYQFDSRIGHFVDSKSKIQIKGTLTLVAPGGQELPGELDLTLEQTSKRK